MITMTFKEYDGLVSGFKDMDTPTLWPTVKQMDEIEKEPGEWMEFMVYLSERGKKPVTKEEEYGKKNVNRFLRKNLILIDNEEERQ